MLFRNLTQTTILNILNVFVMMRMTYISLCNFYENVDMSMIWGIWRHGGRKKVPRRWNGNGATATFRWSDNSSRSRCKRKWAWACHARMVGCSRIPGSHGTAAWQTRNVQRQTGTVQTRASHIIQAFVHGRRLGGYTFEASNRDGSRSEKEVVVHGRSGGRRSRGDVEEVVVHSDGSSGSCRSRTL